MIIKYEDATGIARKLHKAIVEITNDISSDIYYSSREYLIVIPKCADNDIEYPGNIYIDIDYSEEFTVSYGFTHTHFEFDIDTYEEVILQCADFIRKLVQHEVFAYCYDSALGGRFMGFKEYNKEDDIETDFIVMDLNRYYIQKNNSYDINPEIALSYIDELPYKDRAQLSYVFYGEEPVHKKIYEEQ